VIAWIDAGSGASGDMLLGALVGAGADQVAIEVAIAQVAPEQIGLTTGPVTRAGLAACRADVEVADSTTQRGLDDVLDLLHGAGLEPQVEEHAAAVFTRLAEAEALVHGTSVAHIHFHEVGALDAIADIVGVCAGLAGLQLEALHCSPVAVGSGSVSSAHGTLSVPPPAVVELLRGVPSYAGPVVAEMCTPTGAALLSHWVTEWGPQPAMSVSRVGLGAGHRDFAGHANVLRLLIGEAPGTAPGVSASAHDAVVLETNVDDLDPRLWPRILALLLERGASDAWLSPILMKKGRPAHTLSVLVRSEALEQVRAVVYEETSAIGSRTYRVEKDELDRDFETVEISGQRIRVKIARQTGRVVNRQPEYDDVVAAASALGLPVKTVLAQSLAAPVLVPAPPISGG
jgi:hypothetical protein